MYNWSTYKHCTADADGDRQRQNKNNTREYYGPEDGLDVWQSVDDVAAQVLGSGARIPNSVQWRELVKNTTSEWTTVNGVVGRRFTSITNGRSIFLPAAGVRHDSELGNVGSYGYYWTSALDGYTPENAMYFYFYKDDMNKRVDSCKRSPVLSVCPVRSAR